MNAPLRTPALTPTAGSALHWSDLCRPVVRWTRNHRTLLVAAVDSGLLDRAEMFRLHRLSVEEFEDWRNERPAVSCALGSPDVARQVAARAPDPLPTPAAVRLLPPAVRALIRAANDPALAPAEIANRHGSVAAIQVLVARHFGVSVVDLLSRRRKVKANRARMIAMYLARTLTLLSLPAIANRFNGRDHTTVLHAVRKIEALIATDSAVADDVRILRAILEDRS